MQFLSQVDVSGGRIEQQKTERAVRPFQSAANPAPSIQSESPTLDDHQAISSRYVSTKPISINR